MIKSDLAQYDARGFFLFQKTTVLLHVNRYYAIQFGTKKNLRLLKALYSTI